MLRYLLMLTVCALYVHQLEARGLVAKLCSLALGSRAQTQTTAAPAEPYKPVVHDYVSARTGSFVKQVFTQIVPAAEARRYPTPAPFPVFDITSVERGETSLLSLGEGNSDFLHQFILERQKAGLPTDDLKSVDFAYINPVAQTSFMWGDGLDAPTLQRLADYPANYVGQSYQQMNLRNPDGSRKRFKEIVSMSSLNFVLGRYETEFPDPKKREKEIEALMRNILDHLENGGNLRIANGGMGSGVEPNGGSGPTILKVLKRLKNEAIIKNFIVSGDTTTNDRHNSLSYIFIHKK